MLPTARERFRQIEEKAIILRERTRQRLRLQVAGKLAQPA